MCSLTLNLARNQSLAAAGDSDSQLEGPRFRDPLIQALRKSFSSIPVKVILTWNATCSHVALFKFGENPFLRSCDLCCILASAVLFKEVSSSQSDEQIYIEIT
jgi:hypothetical protein